MNHPDRGDLTAVCDLLIILYEYLKKSTISLADCRYLPPNTTRQKGCDTAFRALKGSTKHRPSDGWQYRPTTDGYGPANSLDEWGDVKKVHYTVHIDGRFTLEGSWRQSRNKTWDIEKVDCTISIDVAKNPARHIEQNNHRVAKTRKGVKYEWHRQEKVSSTVIRG